MEKKWVYTGKRWIYDIGEIAVIVLQFVAVFSLLCMICAVTPELPAGETVGQWMWFGKGVWISAGCVIASCLVQYLKKDSWAEILCFQYFSKSVAWSIVLLGGVEAVWGLRQLYGFSVSGHSLYALTGSFFNPGPYGGYLAMALPVCLHCYLHASKCKKKHIFRQAGIGIAGISGLLVLCVLPATMSRSAWIAATVGCAWVAYMHHEKRKWKYLWRKYWRRYLAWGTAGVLVLALAGAGVFFLKPDSALGRLFLWKIACRAIAEHPWGCPWGFAYAYGEAQEKYFSSGNYAAWEERVAGSPEYAFNEYLDCALNISLPLTIILLCMIVMYLRIGVMYRQYGVCGALLALLLFSFSSYPMHIPGFMMAGVFLLIACREGILIGKFLIVGAWLAVSVAGLGDKWKQEEDACRKWAHVRMLYQLGSHAAAQKAYEEIRPALDDRGAFLFEYGHSLHKSGNYEESDWILRAATYRSNDPMIRNVMGKNCQAMGFYWQAEAYYLSAVHLLPGRIYPYYLLAKLYAEPEYRNRERFEEMKRIVLTKEPKVYSTAIKEMRDEVEKMENEWEIRQ
ncbi:O-antigen ligase family protein [uncultured Bacteroides sp.]|uniref:O-antigen ligase family protein n=1 Tax=uncultured Bacteroides sp. TaxID=162156 RepID=UPI002626A479|nr:O-antigen ligase family protein [uncultured Bacteroides sp.]